jgi:tRNA(fMet)-specific endonuclease VapC
MLDTNVCIHLLNRTSPRLARRLVEHPASDFVLSAITSAELSYGVVRSRQREKNARKLRVLREEYETLPFADRAIEVYGAVRADLSRRGVAIGPLDTLIAAHALALDLVLLTANHREFRRVKGLRSENWM